MIIETKILEGNEHYVVPVVMAVEGVMSGNNGPLLYPANELKKSVNLWNGKPVLAYHPDLYTSSVAGNPDIFDRQRIGTIFNTKFKNGKLTAEAWLNVDRLGLVDKRILEAVQDKEMMEVSTGLFMDFESKPGTFNGRQYDAVARNYTPDHLAILPDLKGACSIEDGCGLVRNLQKVEECLTVPQMEF